jgi:hypothetical protein
VAIGVAFNQRRDRKGGAPAAVPHGGEGGGPAQRGGGSESAGTCGVRVAVQNREHWGGCHVWPRQKCGVMAVEFISNSNSNRFQINFKSF